MRLWYPGATQRNPLLLLLFDGSLLLRLAQRQLLELLFQEPPRNTFGLLPFRGGHARGVPLQFLNILKKIRTRYARKGKGLKR
jgi:hypothetical protein